LGGPSTISGINYLSADEKRRIYARVIPPELVEKFHLSKDLRTQDGHDLLDLKCQAGSSTTAMSLYHKPDFPDPVLYGQITDTLNGQFHILLYILNDPDSPRFNVDRMPDGTRTMFGTMHRNLEAEQAAMEAGLAPGQVRRGLRLLAPAIRTFENFVASFHHDLHFAEPLYYHNAILFERYGFAYQQGRRRMERIQAGFEPGGDLLPLLDGSTPFRSPEAAVSIRLRSWAIHDGILGEPFTNVTMYKQVGKSANLSTASQVGW
jgi:hypothetical protein